MPVSPAIWSELIRRTLSCYDEEVVRRVAGRLVKPRNFWPTAELITRSAETLDNPPVLDRRLEELEPVCRQVLAVIGLSRQPTWAVGNLVELAMALGHPDGIKPLLELLDAGLLYPVLGQPRLGSAPLAPSTGVRLRSFDLWLANPGPVGLNVFCPPQVASRALNEPLPLPDLSAEAEEPSPLGLMPQQSDGLEWLLRMAVLWQQAAASPFRRTQQGGFFKRDQERLEQDQLLNGPPSDRHAEVRDQGFLVAGLAELQGILVDEEGELRAGALPNTWDESLHAALAALWADLFHLHTWTPLDGWRGNTLAAPVSQPVGSPFPSGYLLTFLLLRALPEKTWIKPATIESWVRSHHPYWQNESLRPSRQSPWMDSFLLGVVYHLRLVEAGRDPTGGEWVRLSPLGRWLLGSASEEPSTGPTYTQTLLVQPNLEIVAYRQGLHTALIARLTRFASWKTLGAACTLQLEPETVYRALETGESFDSIRLALEQYGTRATPAAVVDSLRTWANKRDRITVFPAATLLEFASATELNDALARGLAAVRIADTLAVVASEDAIDFKHFRLAGTRDYSSQPEKCVTVEPDGVTLTVDLTRSDLLLESELPRFAEALGGGQSTGKKQFRLTPASLSAARESGVTLTLLESWFQQRTGGNITPAARLLLIGATSDVPQLKRHLVLHVGAPDLADGLMQWPPTRALIEARLGPTALVVAAEKAEQLKTQLRSAGMEVQEPDMSGG
jgi:hypothetical protein